MESTLKDLSSSKFKKNISRDFLKNLILKTKYLQKVYFSKDFNFISKKAQGEASPVGGKKVICHYTNEKIKACRKLLISKVVFEGLDANSMKLVDQEKIGNKNITIIQPYKINKKS
jgi:hypothetical protein